MVLLVSDEVRRKNGGPRMVVTGFRQRHGGVPLV